MQLRLLPGQQWHPATYSANYSGLSPALQGTEGAVYVSLREQTPVPPGDVLLYRVCRLCWSCFRAQSNPWEEEINFFFDL